MIKKVLLFLVGPAVLGMVFMVAMAVFVTQAARPPAAAADTGVSLTGLSAYAQHTIPLYAQRLYTDPRVHKVCPQLPAAVLAGIGTVETDNGQNNTTSSAGAQGFMQFEPQTFATYGVAVGHSGPPDIHNNLDSVASAANLLCKNWDKKMSDLPKVIHDVYNHAWWYVCTGVPGCPLYLDGPGNQAPAGFTRGVMAWAKLYEARTLAPTQAASAALAFAVRQLGKPYVWGGTGPSSYDCSGLVMAAYQSAGKSIPRTSEEQWNWGKSHWQFIPPDSPNLAPGDLVFFNPGEQLPGLPGHVGMVSSIKGNTVWIIQAPQPGESIKYTPLGTISGGVFHGPHDLAHLWDYIGAFRPT